MSAQSTAPDPSTYNALIAAHAIAVGNKYYSSTSANDWWTVNNAAKACLNEWVNNGRDAGVQSAVSNISPSSIASSNLDSTSILSTMQNYQSLFTMTDVQQSIAFVDNHASLIPEVLSTLQQNGMSYYITVIMQQSAKIAEGLTNGTMNANAIRANARVRPNVRPGPLPNPGGGYNCATDGALIFAAGLAFATLSVMSLGSFDLLAGAAWAGISLWGGLGTTGWGIGHVVSGCGF